MDPIGPLPIACGEDMDDDCHIDPGAGICGRKDCYLHCCHCIGCEPPTCMTLDNERKSCQ